MKHFLIMVIGPTAVGKTNLSIQLAQFFNTEILSIDSRQFYKELNIGTAKPSESEMQGIKHYFINSHSISEDYNAGDFEKDALALLDKLFNKNKIVIATGGSGLYVKALSEGMDDFPEPDPKIRPALQKKLETHGLNELFVELERLDPDYAKNVDPENPQRILRALEISIHTGRPYSYFRKGEKKQRPFEIIKIGLTRDREDLYTRIDARMDKMLKAGLVNEAKLLYKFKGHNAFHTVGYSEIFDFLEGKFDEGEMIRLLKRNSRRYAKRQITWFGKDSEIQWFHPDDKENILSYINSLI